MRIGLISDTHGLLRPEALAALAGAEAILHAGDVGRASVLEGLAAIAPVHAIRGNIDRDGPIAELPDERILDLAGHRIQIVHDGKHATVAEGVRVLVCGHSHKPLVETRDGVLWVNPGSAGPRRFTLPVCVGWLVLTDGSPIAEVVQLELR
jgi:uncharacterized protein